MFRPLLANEFNSKFALKSPELGDFVYQLQLIGLPSTSQRSMTFKTSLGSDLIQTFKFINYLRKQTTYACRVEKIGGAPKVANAKEDPKKAVVQTDFLLDNPNLVAPPTDSYEGTEIGLNIRFLHFFIRKIS